MATEYNWSFPNFETDSDNKVKTIHWSLNAVDGEHSARSYGSCDGADMDFDSMTKENCITCVIDNSDQTEDEMKANLDIQIEASKNPVTTNKTKEW
tara:strand:+ start:120 stop:407 length:288 start_codon:yes stop_codon:yes gene_type:complete